MSKITPQGIINDALKCKNQLYEGAFPLHIFPKQLQQIIRDTNECLKYSVDFTSASILVAVSACIVNNYFIINTLAV